MALQAEPKLDASGKLVTERTTPRPEPREKKGEPEKK